MSPDSSSHALPWHQRARLRLDRACLLDHLRAAGTEGGLVDARHRLVRLLLPDLVDDLLRLGTAGFLVDGQGDYPRLPARAGTLVIGPHCTTDQALAAANRGALPVLGHQAEVYLLSALAQQRQQPLPLLVRVKNPAEPAADPGPTSLAAILAAITNAPRVRVGGFFLDYPLTSVARAPRLAAAVARHPAPLPTHEPVRCVQTRQAANPPGYRPLPLVAPLATLMDGVDPRADRQPLVNPLTLEAWATPFAAIGRDLEVTLELGRRCGLPDLAERPVLVGGVRGHIVETGPELTRVRLDGRPTMPSPWPTTLIGAQGFEAIAPTDWHLSHAEFALALERLAAHIPCTLT